MAESIVMETGEMLRNGSNLPVIILPGNHDCLVQGRYLAGYLDDIPGIYIVGSGGEPDRVSLVEFDAIFWGRPHSDFEPLHPFQEISSDLERDSGYLVGLGHGHLVQRLGDERDSYRFYMEELEDHPFSYIALGHWDRFHPVSERLRTYYSGAPHYASSVNVIDIHENGQVDVYRLGVTIK